MANATKASVLWAIRIGLVASVCFVFSYEDQLQSFIDGLWSIAKSHWLFNCVYFETWYVTTVYTLLMLVPSVMDGCQSLEAYKIDKNASYQHPSYSQLLQEIIIYITPLMTLDTFSVKKYAGVPLSVLTAKRQSLVQRTRALPDASVPLRQLVWHLAVSIIIYDALFFVFHLAMHKSAFLYKNFHADHHTHHDGLQGRIANKLTVVERLMIILSANFSLRVIGAHPLTRVAFVPVFVWLLIENHWNYDFPYSYEKILPRGLMGGSPYHHAHHCQGTRNYQSLFTYLDIAFHRFTSRRKTKTS